jgi:hypothetical protein
MGFPINQGSAQKAVWRATQDMKAAVRFFRKDAATTDTYKIDSNFVFVGGYSAGAFMAVQYAYMDQPSEVPAAVDTTVLGGFEGNSGNPGYSTAINGVLNFAGAVGDSAWINTGDEPMITVQGNNDATVPYCKAMIYVSGFPIMIVSGGGAMNIRCNNVGVYNPIHTFFGQGHSADVSPVTNLDTTIVLGSDFVYKYLGCTPSNTAIYTNYQTCSAGSGVNEIVLNSSNVNVYPVPASEKVFVELKEVRGKKFLVEVSDITGRKIQEFRISGPSFTLEKKGMEEGIYFLKLRSDEEEVFMTKIVFAK